MRAKVRSLVGRLRQHCDLLGINPPTLALRRYATLRWVESYWPVREKLTQERADLLEDLSLRLRLDALPEMSPMCGPDLANAVWHKGVGAPWPDAPLCVSFRDL